jgi:hypothetical protein
LLGCERDEEGNLRDPYECLDDWQSAGELSRGAWELIHPGGSPVDPGIKAPPLEDF